MPSFDQLLEDLAAEHHREVHELRSQISLKDETPQQHSNGFAEACFGPQFPLGNHHVPKFQELDQEDPSFQELLVPPPKSSERLSSSPRQSAQQSRGRLSWSNLYGNQDTSDRFSSTYLLMDDMAVNPRRFLEDPTNSQTPMSMSITPTQSHKPTFSTGINHPERSWNENAIDAITFPEVSRWFRRLDSDGKGFLTPDDIYKLYKQSFPDIDDHAFSSQAIAQIMTRFNGALEQSGRKLSANSCATSVDTRGVPTRAKSDMSGISTSGCMRERSPMDLDETGFSAVITWNDIESCIREDSIKKAIIQIREVLIVSTIDQLILKHSNLSLRTRNPFELVIMSKAERFLEPVVLCTVCINALTIGLNSEYNWSGFGIMEIVFTSVFLIELIIKFGSNGVNVLYRPDWKWTYFDTIIVMFAVVDIFFTQVTQNETVLGNATLLRLARLARLTRVLRLVKLLRMGVFKELFQMVSGVSSGLATLFWALILLMILVYVAAVVVRQTMGEDELYINDGHVLFETLPDSMFTVFRCFIGDAVLNDGSPLAGRLYERYKGTFAIPYALVMLFISFGICNLIMAIFVENVQQQARLTKQMQHHSQGAKVVRTLRELVLLFGGGINKEAEPKKPRHSFSPLFERTHTQQFLPGLPRGSRLIQGACAVLPKSLGEKLRTRITVMTPLAEDTGPLPFQHGGVITKIAFMKVMRKKKAKKFFDDLEIDIRDTRDLFDILDADGSGHVDLSELISGLLKLRAGGADKSDVVATILGIRALQLKMDALKRSVDMLCDNCPANNDYSSPPMHLVL